MQSSGPSNQYILCRKNTIVHKAFWLYVFLSFFSYLWIPSHMAFQFLCSALSLCLKKLYLLTWSPRSETIFDQLSSFPNVSGYLRLVWRILRCTNRIFKYILNDWDGARNHNIPPDQCRLFIDLFFRRNALYDLDNRIRSMPGNFMGSAILIESGTVSWSTDLLSKLDTPMTSSICSNSEEEIPMCSTRKTGRYLDCVHMKLKFINEKAKLTIFLW